jgi:hypothetical protein
MPKRYGKVCHLEGCAVKQRFTLEEHRQIGRELHDLSEHLARLASELGNRFPLADGYYVKLRQAGKQLNSVRSRLEDAMFKDCAREVREAEAAGENMIDVYYPGGSA